MSAIAEFVSASNSESLRSEIAEHIKAQLKCVPFMPPDFSWREKIAHLVQEFGTLPQVECPLQHYFAPGVYIREIFMPAGSIVIGKIHKTEHFNIIQRGAVSLIGEDGSRQVLRGPHTFVSKAGVQKVLYIHEDTVWSTVHLTDERDLDKLEAMLIEPDKSYPKFDREQERLGIEKAHDKLKQLMGELE